MNFFRIAVLVLLSGTDLLLTWWLLERSACVIEANPLARWWLQSSGWLGLALFKGGCTAVAIGSITVVARRRPRAARYVHTFGCTVLALVVAYSAVLAQSAQTPSEFDQEIKRELDELNRWAGHIDESKAYRALGDRLMTDFLTGRATAPEIVEQLRADLVAKPRRVRLLSTAFGYASPEDCAVAQVHYWIEHYLWQRPDRADVLNRFAAELGTTVVKLRAAYQQHRTPSDSFALRPSSSTR